jgi:hypothetical protein
MINIDDKTHDKLLKLLDKLELDIMNAYAGKDRDYPDGDRNLQIAIAKAKGASEAFDIINGNT